MMDEVDFKDFLATEAVVEAKVKEFAKHRLEGAKKIASQSQAKGGDSMLTYYHFTAKFPYYEKVIAGTLSRSDLKKEYLQLCNRASAEIGKEKRAFQEFTGKLEVVGELFQAYGK